MRVAADILAAQGLEAMLKYEDWSIPRGAAYYASWNEMDKRALGILATDFSEDEAR